MLVFREDAEKMTSTVRDFSSHSDISKVQEVSAEAEHIYQQLQDLVTQSKALKSRAALLGMEAQADDLGGDLTKIVCNFVDKKVEQAFCDSLVQMGGDRKWTQAPAGDMERELEKMLQKR